MFQQVHVLLNIANIFMVKIAVAGVEIEPIHKLHVSLDCSPTTHKERFVIPREIMKNAQIVNYMQVRRPRYFAKMQHRVLPPYLSYRVERNRQRKDVPHRPRGQKIHPPSPRFPLV